LIPQEQHIAIRVSGVSKQYTIVDTTKVNTIPGLLHLKNKKKIWALRDINLEVNKGEAVGIIGPNGAGKSTLLKILSGVTRPTNGRVEIFGTVASVLEIGLGFHPDLTGRENVFLSGSLLGFSKKHILDHFQEIVDFSEIQEFIDTPVKHYSSGMFIRLAFSMVSNIDADIMLFDEALNVGDNAFQQKSSKKIFELIGKDKTVLIVSHNMNDITKLCNKVVHIENGAVRSIGKPNDSVINYLDTINPNGEIQTLLNFEHNLIKEINDKSESFGLVIQEIEILPESDPHREALYWSDELIIRITLEKKGENPLVAFGFNFSHFGYLFLSINSTEAKGQPLYIGEPGHYAVELKLPPGYLNTTVYNADFFISDKSGNSTIEVKNLLTFKLTDEPSKTENLIFKKQSSFSGPMKTQTNWEKIVLDPLR